MAQVISSASAFNAGHDLWVVPDRKGSRWTLRLDWYLNFQISRGERRRTRALEEPVKALLEESGLTDPGRPEAEGLPLLIGADGRLPARWVLLLPTTEASQPWVEQLAEVWTKLQKPTMKVFLPTGWEGTPFMEAWKRHSSLENFALILDQDPNLQGQ